MHEAWGVSRDDSENLHMQWSTGFPEWSATWLWNRGRDRPKVAAADRIHSWETPFSKKFKEELEDSLPPELVNTLQSTIYKALAPNTRNSYGAGIRKFSEFCDRFNIPEESRMPASNILLTAFVSEYSGTCSGSCIKNWMSGIKAWHDYNGAPWSGDSRLVHLARSTANKEGKTFSRPQRNPITTEHLRILRSNLNISNPSDAATWAIASCAFWGCRRLGELTIPSRSSFDPKFHMSRSSQAKPKFNSNTLISISLDIPWTKSMKEKGGRIVLTARPDELCPVAALLNHLHVNNGIPLNLPFFTSIAPDGSFQLPVKKDFLDKCKKLMSSPNLSTFAGHSFRIGGTVELLLSGVSPEVVASLGEWSSMAFLLYWRKIDEIIPQHIFKAYDRNKLIAVASEIESFQVRSNIRSSDIQ